jgi:hypothetical protein
MPTLIIHIQNEEPIVGDVDDLPSASDTLIFIKNPRRKDGKDLPNIDSSVMSVGWPLARINFFEILPSGTEEEIISFVREK